ncbi:ATP-binding protein [Aquibacillus kalidii]|uniref:ATP-binding protein n=1 Tax=Aquibacillus kalidii TaxID=2762597 RepID=UPI0016468852|nr:ATP-binding protein [Aquibacillus kalidii]
MKELKSSTEFKHRIETDQDIQIILLSVRSMLNKFPFSDTDKQSIHVCSSELIRNVLKHSGSIGEFHSYFLKDLCIIIRVIDKGKGIENVEEILNGDNLKHSSSLGLGLLGSSRLMDELLINTSEKGTEIVAMKWVTPLISLSK